VRAREAAKRTSCGLVTGFISSCCAQVNVRRMAFEPGDICLIRVSQIRFTQVAEESTPLDYLHEVDPAEVAITVRGSSRRIKIMRLRPANIRLIHRRLKLPQLLLALSSKYHHEKKRKGHALTRSLYIRPIRCSRLVDAGQ
jgi:hypothetical protein